VSKVEHIRGSAVKWATYIRVGTERLGTRAATSYTSDAASSEYQIKRRSEQFRWIENPPKMPLLAAGSECFGNVPKNDRFAHAGQAFGCADDFSRFSVGTIRSGYASKSPGQLEFRSLWVPRVMTTSEAVEGSTTWREMDFMKRIQNNFCQESVKLMKPGSITGILKEHRSPCKETSWRSFGHSRGLSLGIWRQFYSGLHTTQDNNHWKCRCFRTS
jgi:hypothetical protein